MATTQNCTFKSVTLAAGEQFVLPPGAEIVAATNGLEDYTSTCAKPTSLESPTCYSFRFSGRYSERGNYTENWESDSSDKLNYSVTGITVDTIYYPFTTAFQGTTNQATVLAALNTTPFTGMFTSFNNIGGGDNHSWTNGFTFATIPSIGDTMYFEIQTEIQNQNPFTGSTPASVRVIKTSEFTLGNVPACIL